MGNLKKRNHKKKNKQNIIKKDKALLLDNTEDKNNDDSLDNQPASENEVIKRKLINSDEECDDEEKPKKKKKKKNNPETQVSGKGKKSNRQVKKEKFAQRQAEAESLAKNALKQQCLSYLSQWKHAKDQWKFMKARQVWLYKNKFSSKMIPDESWLLLLEYFESAKGNIKTMLLDDANKIIKQMDNCLEKDVAGDKSEQNEAEEADGATKPDDITYKRARDIIQHLQE